MTLQSLKKSNEFKHIFTIGNKKIGKYVILYIAPGKHEDNRVGIVTKKEIGNAVHRNRVKRIIREIWRTRCIQLIFGYDVVILARKRIIYAKFSEIEAEIVKLIQL